MYPLHLASYVIHKLNAIPVIILEWNTMLYSLFKPPFQLLCSHRMIAWPFETLVPSYIALNKFVGIQLVGYLVCFPLSSPTDAQLCGDAFFRSFFPFVVFIGWWRSRRKDDNLVMVTWSREMNTSMYWIGLIEKSKPEWEEPLNSLPNFPPLLHRLNLGTRFLVVEENCDARVVTLQ